MTVLEEEGAVRPIIQETQRGNDKRTQRWHRTERAELFAQDGDLQAIGLSQRQAAKVLEVPRSTLQAGRAYYECLDASLVVVAFFHSVCPVSPSCIVRFWRYT
jgi:hypothetical protein